MILTFNWKQGFYKAHFHVKFLECFPGPIFYFNEHFLESITYTHLKLIISYLSLLYNNSYLTFRNQLSMISYSFTHLSCAEDVFLLSYHRRIVWDEKVTQIVVSHHKNEKTNNISV